MYIFCALRSTVSQPEDEVRDVVPSSLFNVLSCQSFVIHSLQGGGGGEGVGGAVYCGSRASALVSISDHSHRSIYKFFLDKHSECLSRKD